MPNSEIIYPGTSKLTFGLVEQKLVDLSEPSVHKKKKPKNTCDMIMACNSEPLVSCRGPVSGTVLCNPRNG